MSSINTGIAVRMADPFHRTCRLAAMMSRLRPRNAFLILFLIIANSAEAQIAPRVANPEVTVDLPGAVTMDFVWIEPGTFLMGSPDSDPYAAPAQKPQHEVTITRGFYLGKYEITQGEWEAVMGTRPWSGQRYVRENPDHPAVYISWEEVQEFIQRLNTAAGEELYRLPTEAEWEYACRAGTTTRWSFGDDESQLGEYAWYRGNAWDAGLQYAQPIGTQRPNPWGLYDMHGNAWEWVQDWYSLDYYDSSPGVDPPGPASGSLRGLRGGSFHYIARRARSDFRAGYPPDFRYYTTGARVLRMGPPPTAVTPQTWGEVKAHTMP